MPTARYRSIIPAPASELFDWHGRPGTFERLVPPWQSVDIVARDGSIRDGDRLAMDIKLGPFRMRWLALHSDFIEGVQFRDTQLVGPFKHWVHTHRVHPRDANTSILDDRIEYELPGEPITDAIAGRFVAREIRRMFRFRHLRTRNDLARHLAFDGRPRLRMSITGSGELRDQLSAFLQGGGHTLAESGQIDCAVDLLDKDSRELPTCLYRDNVAVRISVMPVRFDAPFHAPSRRWVTIYVSKVVASVVVRPRSFMASRLSKVSDELWISQDDLIGAIYHAMLTDSVSGRVFPSPTSTSDELHASGFRYFYPTMDNAMRAMTGSL